MVGEPRPASIALSNQADVPRRPGQKRHFHTMAGLRLFDEFIVNFPQAPAITQRPGP